jgi:hypothetical protein
MRMLKAKGPKCFLDPINLKYPICPQRSRATMTYQGLMAAKKRAMMEENMIMYRKAKRLLKRYFKK